MSPCTRGSHRNNMEQVADSDSDSDDQSCDNAGNHDSNIPSAAQGVLGSLDDDALFDVVKKIVCTSVRQIISNPCGTSGVSQGHNEADKTTMCMGRGASLKPVTRLNVTYFSEVLEALNPDKRRVIEEYGFGSLLKFDKCSIPIGFSRWVVDHIRVNSWEIVLRNKSINITPQTIHDVLGIPLGGKTIFKADPQSGKFGFLAAMNLTSLPSVRTCGENLLKDSLSNDDIVRNFLLVALVTFLCPNSTVFPSTEYLKPLVDVKTASSWHWSKFVHYWLFKQIKKYHRLLKTTDHASITMGGCLYVLCVLYLDYLNTGKPPLPPTFPRICVWKGDMIKEMSKLDCVQGQTYGKHALLPMKSTCYYKRTASSTPSPSCVVDGDKFKQTLNELLCGKMDADLVDGVTSIFLKHAASPLDSPAEFVQTIILDVLGYFYEQTKNGRLSDNRNSQEQGTSNNPNDNGGNDSQENANSGDTVVIPSPVGEFSSFGDDSVAETVKASSSGGGSQIDGRRVSNSPGSTIAGRTRSHQPSFSPDVSAPPPRQAPFVDNPEAILRKSKMKRTAKRVHVDCGDVDIATINVEGFNTSASTAPHASAPPPNVELTHNALKRVINKGLKDRLAKRQKMLDSSDADVQVDNCSKPHDDEDGTGKDKNDTIPSEDFGLEKEIHEDVGCSAVESAHARFQTHPEKSASFDHMLDQDSSNRTPRVVDPPSVGIKERRHKSVNISDASPPSFRLLEDFDDNGNFIQDPRKRRPVGLSCDGTTIYDDPRCLNDEAIPAASGDVEADVTCGQHSYSDDVEKNEDIAATGVDIDSDSAQQSNEHHVREAFKPVFDKTPLVPPHATDSDAIHPMPLAIVDSQGNLIMSSEEEEPVTPEVQIVGQQKFTFNTSDMAKKADALYNESDMSCFAKCSKIGFNLGSTSAGFQPRRSRRFIQPNSYYRNFETNFSKAKFNIRKDDLACYDCVMFYSSHPDYASNDVINYDNVRVTFQQLGTLRRSRKLCVDKFVINAFCRMLFKDKHPRDSRRHYFFSTIGDYLLDHDGRRSFLYDTCAKCFKLANGCFKFTSSDYLFFPILHDDHWFVFVVAIQDGYFVFLDSFFKEDELYQEDVRKVIIPNFVKAWDQFVGIEWNFHEFVIHHAPVPKHDLDFFSKYDDGIFVMKYLELWDPRVNLLQKFSARNISDIRLHYMNDMVFSTHNREEAGQRLVWDHQRMIEMRDKGNKAGTI